MTRHIWTSKHGNFNSTHPISGDEPSKHVNGFTQLMGMNQHTNWVQLSHFHETLLNIPMLTWKIYNLEIWLFHRHVMSHYGQTWELRKWNTHASQLRGAWSPRELSQNWMMGNYTGNPGNLQTLKHASKKSWCPLDFPLSSMEIGCTVYLYMILYTILCICIYIYIYT